MCLKTDLVINSLKLKWRLWFNGLHYVGGTRFDIICKFTKVDDISLYKILNYFRLLLFSLYLPLLLLLNASVVGVMVTVVMVVMVETDGEKEFGSGQTSFGVATLSLVTASQVHESSILLLFFNIETLFLFVVKKEIMVKEALMAETRFFKTLLLYTIYYTMLIFLYQL